MAFTASPPNLSAKSPKITGVLRLSSPPTNTFRQKTGLDYILAEAVTQLALTNTVRFGYYLFSPSRRRPGPMLPQAPEFDRFLRPCPIGPPHDGCTMGHGLPPASTRAEEPPRKGGPPQFLLCDKVRQLTE